MKYFCYAVVCFLCVSLSSFSQEKYSVRPKQKSQDNETVFVNSGKYYLTYRDYLAGKYGEVSNLIVSGLSTLKTAIRIGSKDKSLDKLLEKDAHIVSLMAIYT